MKRKPVVGETLFRLDKGIRDVREPLTPVEVTKVGRLYFTAKRVGASDWAGRKYGIDNWTERTEFGMDRTRLFESEQDFNEMLEGEALSKRIGEWFSYGNNTKGISVADLRKIAAILGIDTHTKGEMGI